MLMRRAGAPIEVLQEALGHANINNTRISLHVTHSHRPPGETNGEGDIDSRRFWSYSGQFNLIVLAVAFDNRIPLRVNCFWLLKDGGRR